MRILCSVVIFMLALGLEAGAGNAPRIGILDLGLKKGNGIFGCPSSPTAFESALSGHYTTVRMSGDDVCNPAFFNRERVDLIVIPTGSAFPMDAVGNLKGFLSRGGHMLTCGGYAFDTPVFKEYGVWRKRKTVSADIPVPAGTESLNLSADAWAAVKGSPSAVSVKETIGPAGEPGVLMHTSALSLWGQISAKTDLRRKSVISFMLRGDANTTNVWFELRERDGSRWHVKLPLSQDWKEFRITPVQLSYYFHNPSKWRGGPGDFVNFDNVSRIYLGITGETGPGIRHDVSLSGLRAGVDPAADERRKSMPLPAVNTRTGTVKDSILVKPDQIGVFDPAFELRDVSRMSLAQEMKGVFPMVERRGAVRGFSAVAPLGLDGPGFGPNRATWRPLLSCQDASGAPRGHAGAIVHHHTGMFEGSSWAFFGVDDDDLFVAGGDISRNLLLPVVDSLLNRLYLHDTTSGYSCYRRGEVAILKTVVANFGKPREVEVRFRLSDESGREIATVAGKCSVSKKATTVELSWPVPDDAPDFLFLSAELSENGRLCDREHGALVVWDDKVIASGPQLSKDGSRFAIDGKSRFSLGSQMFWGQHANPSARSPLRFYEDFRQMRNFGMKWTRCFLNYRAEQGERRKRDADAAVQLAQKFGIVMYFAPNMGVTRDAACNAAFNTTFAEIAERYKNVPGLAIDIANEPRMRESPSRDAVDVQCNWVRTNREAGNAVRPGLMFSVGWVQGWANAIDPLVASTYLDFTDRHIYGDLNKVVHELKTIDLRVTGKPVLIGECGGKNHPSYNKNGEKGVDDETYNTRFRYMVSHAFGLGASSLLSWHWRDPMEGIFPCGMVHQTGVPRPAARLFARMGEVFGKLELVDNPPDVVVLADEESRMKPGDCRVRTIEVMNAIHHALAYWGANWSTLTSSREADIPSSVKLVLRTGEFESVEDVRGAVGTCLKRSGAFFTRRPGDSVALETFRVPGKGAVGWVFWNGGDRSVLTERNGYSITVEPNRAGYLQISDDGSLQVREVF